MDIIFVCLLAIFFIVFPIIRFYNKEIVPSKNLSLKCKLHKYAVFANGTLYLEKRHPDLFKAFKIYTDKNQVVSYKPESYVYTGATVGGITTGGVHKAGGYNYISSEYKSGKYQLYYAGEFVSRIALTDKLYNKAKNSTIEKYLGKNKEIIVVIPVGVSTTSMILMERAGANSPLFLNNLQEESKEGYPSYEKCEEIINWICCVGETSIQ